MPPTSTPIPPTTTLTSAPPTVTATPTELPCHVQSSEFVKKLESLFDDWDDANAVAGSTARLALAPAVKDLQRIRRQVTDLAAPDCAQFVKPPCVTYMDHVIDSYLAFMKQEPDWAVRAHLTEADDALIAFSMALHEIKTGEKLPTRTMTPTNTPTNTPMPGCSKERAVYLGEPVELTSEGEQNVFRLTVNRVMRGEEAIIYRAARNAPAPESTPSSSEEFVVTEGVMDYVKGPKEEQFWFFPHINIKIHENDWGGELEVGKDGVENLAVKVELLPGESQSFWVSHIVQKDAEMLNIYFLIMCEPCDYDILTAYFYLRERP